MTCPPMIAGIDKPVSSLALGTVSFRLANREASYELLDAFVAGGGTLLDVARVYSGGESEAVLGHWLAARPWRAQVIVATKGGHGGTSALLPADCEQAITDDLAQSLNALRTDYVDLYFLHRDNPLVPVGRIVERLNRELERGTVHALGASNWSYARVDEANAYAQAHGLRGFTVVSNNLSLAVPTAPFYPRLVTVDAKGECWHMRTQIPLLSWSSQARGFFTGQFVPQATSPADAFAQRMIEVYGTPANLERLRRAQELGTRKGGYSAVQIALAWLLHKPFPLVPIVGPRTGEELVSCLAARAITLTASECRWLNLEVD